MIKVYGYKSGKDSQGNPKGCSMCEQTKHRLIKEGLQFEYRLLDVSTFQDLSLKYGVQSAPLVLKDDKVVVGYLNEIVRFLKEY